VLAIDAPARLELIDGRRADVALDPAAEQIVEHAQAQRAADRVDAVGRELLHRRRHDGEPAREHRCALGLERVQRQAANVSRRDHALAQAQEPVPRDAGGREAVLLEDFGQRQRGSRRCVGRGPVAAVEVAGDRLDLLAARYFGDPLQYWRIADANPAPSPDELLEPGRVLIIPRVS